MGQSFPKTVNTPFRSTTVKLSDFDYDLPQKYIAQEPAKPRDSSRLMVVWPYRTEHRVFRDIADYVRPGDVFVINNTRVFPARLHGRKPTGGKIDILLLRRLRDGEWEALLGGKHLREGEITVGGRPAEILEHISEGKYIIRIDERVMETAEMPIPPYIHRIPDDPERYNTVFAEKTGSVAAPTAGLHFTPELMEELRKRGVKFAEITLHVGIGTFMPVRAENVEEHRMEREYYTITQEAAELINNAGRLFVVGTTATRAIESAPHENNKILPSEGWADIFIYPGYSFKNRITALITNFHLPKSTLLMLVSAFAGRERILDAYGEAVEREYRFYSFGDAMLLWNPQGLEGENERPL